jgi:Flp pilus assembly protein TadG
MKLSSSWRGEAGGRDRFRDQPDSSGQVSASVRLGLALRRRLRAFGRDDAGATAVEFGFIGLLFLTVLLAILQFALLFFAQLNLDNALSDATTGDTAATYANNRTLVAERICGRLLLMDGCEARILLEMQPLKNYAAAGQAITGTVFAAGGAGEMTLMRARAPVLTVVPGLPQLWISGQAVFMRPA